MLSCQLIHAGDGRIGLYFPQAIDNVKRGLSAGILVSLCERGGGFQ